MQSENHVRWLLSCLPRCGLPLWSMAFRRSSKSEGHSSGQSHFAIAATASPTCQGDYRQLVLIEQISSPTNSGDSIACTFPLCVDDSLKLRVRRCLCPPLFAAGHTCSSSHIICTHCGPELGVCVCQALRELSACGRLLRILDGRLPE